MVLYMHLSTIAQRACDAMGVINRLPTTNLVDVNWTVSVINRFQTPTALLMTPLILRPAVDEDDRGRQIQIFGGKASEPETS